MWKCLNISIISPLLLLYANVGRSSRLSLSAYSRSPSPSTSFVALICTFSSASMYFFRCGDQTDWPYSRWGLTKDMKMSLNESQSKYWKLRLICPTRPFATRTLRDMCSAKVNSESTIIPRSFSSSTCSNSLPHIWYRCAWWIFSNSPNVRTWHLSALNPSCQISDHASNFVRSDWSEKVFGERSWYRQQRRKIVFQ